jgi:acyl carrier protein
MKLAENGEAALQGSPGQTELRIIEGLRDIVRDVLDDDSVSLDMATTARDIAGWDSLANIRIILAAEKAFGIKISTTDLMALRNVGDFVRLVASRRSG